MSGGGAKLLGQIRHERFHHPGYSWLPPGRSGAGEVGDVVFGRVHDPVLLMQIDHRRLNIGMAQHGLDLSNRGPMVQGQRSRRMAQRMGRNRADRLGLRIEQPSEAGLLQMAPHHGLNGPDAQGPAATMLGHIVLLGVVFPRPPQPTEEWMLREANPGTAPPGPRSDGVGRHVSVHRP